MKNALKLSALVFSLSIISACALTPAQKAAQAQERAKQMLDTQVSLAQQCNAQTASLMAQMPNVNQLSPNARKDFEAKYVKAVNNKAFQACYDLAWKSYREQNEIRAQQMAAWEEASENAWNNGFFFNDPFVWDNWYY